MHVKCGMKLLIQFQTSPLDRLCSKALFRPHIRRYETDALFGQQFSADFILRESYHSTSWGNILSDLCNTYSDDVNARIAKTNIKAVNRSTGIFLTCCSTAIRILATVC